MTHLYEHDPNPSVILVQAEPPAPSHAHYGRALMLVLLLLVAGAARLPRLEGRLADLDSWRQTDTASIAHLFLDEPNILYPRVFWGKGPGYVEAEFQLYPYVVSLIYRIAGENPLYGRWLSIALALGSIALLYKIARQYLPPLPSYAAAAFFAFAPVYFRYSRQFMPEAAVVFFYLLALERFLVFLRQDTWPHIMQAALAMCLAILIKPTSIHLGLALVILSFHKYGRRAFFNRKLMAYAAISLIPSAMYYIHAMGLFFTYGNTFGVIAGGDSKWTSLHQFLSVNFYWQILRMSLLQTVGVIGALLTLIGFSLRLGREWRPVMWAWLISFGVYCLLLGRSTGDEGRGLQYHVFAAPLMSLAAAASLLPLFRSPKRYAPVAAAVLCLFVLGVQLRQDHDILTRRIDLFQYDAGIRLAQLSRPDEKVIVLSRDPVIDHGRQNNFEEPKVFFYAKRWGRSLGFDQQNGQALNELMATGPQWFVNFPAFNKSADPSYFAAISSRMQLAARGRGYEIYRMLPSGGRHV